MGWVSTGLQHGAGAMERVNERALRLHSPSLTPSADSDPMARGHPLPARSLLLLPAPLHNATWPPGAPTPFPMETVWGQGPGLCWAHCSGPWISASRAQLPWAPCPQSPEDRNHV